MNKGLRFGAAALVSAVIAGSGCGPSSNGDQLFNPRAHGSGSQPGQEIGGRNPGDPSGGFAPGTGGQLPPLGGFPTGTGGRLTGGYPPGSGGWRTGGTGPALTGGTNTASGGWGNTGATCTWSGAPSSGNGELTCYWFSQGTTKGEGCPSYKTYCGYCGTESGSPGGTCPSGITMSVSNMSTAYLAAMKGPGGPFGDGKYCGMCVEVTYGGKSIVATVIDACATCNSDAHVDLGVQGAVALGMGQGSTPGDVTGASWRAVDCPVTGSIIAVPNNGYTGQYYFQNVAFPVASATVNGTGSQQYGYWDFGTYANGKQVTLRDTVGHTVTGTLPSGSGPINAQFPLTCQ